MADLRFQIQIWQHSLMKMCIYTTNVISRGIYTPKMFFVCLCYALKNPGIHSKKCWVVLTQFWVKYGQTQTLG